jgi:anti-sigma regulatory factor (Ser/Thr protein kinase)
MWQFKASDAYAAIGARRDFSDYLRASCTPDSDCESAVIVFGELVANVVRHAPGAIDITASGSAGNNLTLDVRDTGPPFSAGHELPPDPSSDHGRGLFIVSNLCRSVKKWNDGNGNTVRAELPARVKA